MREYEHHHHLHASWQHLGLAAWAAVDGHGRARGGDLRVDHGRASVSLAAVVLPVWDDASGRGCSVTSADAVLRLHEDTCAVFDEIRREIEYAVRQLRGIGSGPHQDMDRAGRALDALERVAAALDDSGEIDVTGGAA